ncbi:hypothetical protein ACUXZZ_45165 (plasmid) [Streptomyces graminifolii]|uniref:hypothetical protein n=1 Tax=Streptomyces graminifolii TaxID=1266771 RepID=UPI00405A28DB
MDSTTNLSLPEQTLREAALTAIHKTIGDTLTGVRTDMQQTLDTLGVERLAVTLPDGSRVGSITVTTPTPKPAITDQAAFLRFVEEIAPDEVTTVKAVRPAYLKKLLDEMEKRGAAEIVDPEHGDITEVEGVEMQTARAATHSVTFEKSGRDALVAAATAGHLDHIEGLPQLTSGSAQ